MRSYQLFSLLAITAGVAFVAGLRIGESRGGTAAPIAVACDTCCTPAKPAGTSTAKPLAIPTGSGRPCLVEFGSDECDECRRMAQVLAEITPRLKGKADLVGVDTDVHPDQAQRWRLRMVPTQIIVDAKGQELWRHEGYLATGELLAKVKGAAGEAP
jgi:hypothetical protein